MQWARNLILVALAIVSYLLILAWQKDYGNTTPNTSAESAVNRSVEPVKSTDLPAPPPANSDVPTVANASAVAELNSVAAASTALIHVKTDVLDLKIDPVGGDIVNLSLPTYTTTVDSQEAFKLLQNSREHTYIAQSGLIGTNGPDQNPQGRPLYRVAKQNYQLTNQNTLEIPFVYSDNNGVEIQKIFTFNKGKYEIGVRYNVINRSQTPWHGVMFAQLKRDASEDPSKNHQGFGMVTYLGGAWGTTEKNYNKISFGDFSKEPLKEKVTGGWTAIVQHYFVTAWVPEANTSNYLSTRSNDKGEYFIGFTSSDLTVNPGLQQSVKATLYAGPKLQDQLAKLSTGLELTVDYGFLWFISQFLFWVLQLLHGFLGNWGWSIVFLTLFVKLAFFHLSATSYKSMANMRRVMPEMQRIKEQYGNDRQKMSQAMMSLYQKEKINPVAGCLPILVQMPVFLALYWTLMESVELRHAPWLLWITDLAAMDKYFVLPLIMGVTMYIQQMLNPQPTDPMQAKVLKIMPIMFTVFMLWFPSGLVLYWVVNNILSIAQQWVINRQIEGADKK
ncbi:protein translocase subunit yidC [Agitococcus lubricus]|uniref:Membrane protein insertase YidC n=2 Tax=Agitococcus lubricus TaxID=1077255 RepID=A0A2T5J3P8_9GAMM|nr:membrane protein insertase YidC [Agitococcus lubricus]PTQ91235.1 protein translocase subunit yidC [Agitococcus lubricus]